MAMIGDGAAVAEMGAHHHELHGHVAFAAWLGVHAWLMSGVRQRVDAFVSWGWDFLGSQPVELDHRRPRRRPDRLGRRRRRERAGRQRGGNVSDHYDVIIIGSGAGGGTLAHTLAASGRRILLLERGDFLPREMDNWDPEPVFIKGKYISPETWYDADGKPFQPQVHYNVGGATKLYGAALYRLRPQDFGEIRHVDGLSPAWPLTYDDFEPWYTKAEWLYQVHGNAGEDPTEGPRSEPYPWPAVSHEPRIQQLSDELAAGGYHPFHAPCGILLDEADRARSTCIRCTWCDGYPCLVHAKADAETIAVRPLLDLPNVTLLVDAEVLNLETDPTGRSITGVVVSRGAAASRSTPATSSSCRPARPTRPSCSSTRPTTSHPNGLANGSDQVGRNYMFHNCKAVVALAKEANDTVFQKTVGLNDFYFGAPDYDWPVGNIQMIGKSNAEAMKGEEPKLTKLAPHFSLAEVARHALDFWLTTEDLPKPDNRVTVDDDGHIHLAYQSTNDEEADRLYHELKKLLNHVGLARHHVLDKNFYMHMDISVAGVAHQAGTCRFGDRPGDLGARRRLQGPRARQPLRRRHQLLPEHRRREPGAHRHGQRHPRRRAPRPTGWASARPDRTHPQPINARELHHDNAAGQGGHRHRWQQRHRQGHRAGARP